jgi:hypothetical protein
LWHAGRPPLWAARSTAQVFAFEQHAHPFTSGPAIVFTELLPEMDYFNHRGGRVLPLYHPGGRPNLAAGLINALSTLLSPQMFGGTVAAGDVLAYIAAITSHPAFTSNFSDELTTPGVRVPITADPTMWEEAVRLGRRVLWLHTYGHRYADDTEGRPAGNVRYPSNSPRRILNITAVTDMPDQMTYDSITQTLHLGAGTWRPVSEAAFAYVVGGKNVLRSWINYRKRVPGGRKTSPLDDVHLANWPSDWSRDLTDLLSVLEQLVELESAQADLLHRVLAGALLSRGTLHADHGVSWPTTTGRRPDYAVAEVASNEDETTGRLF